MDVHCPEQRSFNMSQIKGKNTKPELLIRKWLWANGYRYRLHYKNLPGKPDLVFPGRKKVIFVHGCFWHRHDCRYFKWPKSNSEFWRQKIEGNVERDQKNSAALVASGWVYLIIWECTLKDTKKADLPEKLAKIGSMVEKFLASSNDRCLEIDNDGIHQLNIPTEAPDE